MKKLDNLLEEETVLDIIDTTAGLPRGIDTLCQVTEKVEGEELAFHINNDEISVCYNGIGTLSNVFDKLEPELSDLFDHILEVNSEIDDVVVYGVLVSPDEFNIFDITANGVYLDANLVSFLVEMFDLEHVPIIKHSVPLDEALCVNTVSGCDIVVKPVEVITLDDGRRVAIKVDKGD